LNIDFVGAIEDNTILSHTPGKFLETLSFAGATGPLEEHPITILKINEDTSIKPSHITGINHHLPHSLILSPPSMHHAHGLHIDLTLLIIIFKKR
jgi:hypothetical protein